MLRLKAVIEDGIVDVLEADPVDDVLELALVVIRTETAAGRHPRLPDGTLVTPAFGAFITDEAARWVFAQDELEHLPTEFPEGFRVGPDFHPLLGGRAAGQRVTTHPLDFHHAQPAAAEGRQVLVGAERGNIDVVDFGRAMDGNAFGKGYGPAVDLHSQGAKFLESHDSPSYRRN